MLKRLLTVMLLSALCFALPAAMTETEAPAAEAPIEAPEDGADAAEDEPAPARGYVLVSSPSRTGWLPLPDEGEYAYSLKQVLPDGTETENVIHVTPEGVYMEDSTCENHDCINQGEVTLDNRKDRILGNMIICLPNQVYLELHTPEEVLEMLEEQAAEQP